MYAKTQGGSALLCQSVGHSEMCFEIFIHVKTMNQQVKRRLEHFPGGHGFRTQQGAAVLQGEPQICGPQERGHEFLVRQAEQPLDWCYPEAAACHSEPNQHW